MLRRAIFTSAAIFFAARLPFAWQCAPTAPSGSPPRMSGVTNARNSNANSYSSRCGRCSPLPVRREDNSSQPITQSRGTGEDGCPTITVNCVGISNDAATILTWYDSAGTDIGSTFGSGTVTAVLRCNNRNQLTLTNGTVSSVECISG